MDRQQELNSILRKLQFGDSSRKNKKRAIKEKKMVEINGVMTEVAVYAEAGSVKKDGVWVPPERKRSMRTRGKQTADARLVQGLSTAEILYNEIILKEKAEKEAKRLLKGE